MVALDSFDHRKAEPFGMAWTVWNGVGYSRRGWMILLLKLRKSTQIWIPPPFFVIPTIGCTQAVGSIIFLMMPCLFWSLSSSLSICMRRTATVRDPRIYTGMASAISSKWQGWHVIGRQTPSKMTYKSVFKSLISLLVVHLWGPTPVLPLPMVMEVRVREMRCVKSREYLNWCPIRHLEWLARQACTTEREDTMQASYPASSESIWKARPALNREERELL